MRAPTKSIVISLALSLLAQPAGADWIASKYQLKTHTSLAKARRRL